MVLRASAPAFRKLDARANFNLDQRRMQRIIEVSPPQGGCRAGKRFDIRITRGSL